jgi:hypothetical protein
MPLTREERNVRRAVQRFDHQQQAYNRMLHDLMRVYQDAPVKGTTHEKILEHRLAMMDSKAWKDLPYHWHARLNGVNDVLFTTLSNGLIWTHVLDGVRVRCKEVPDNRLRDLDMEQSAHCYLIDGRLIPWEDKRRVLDSDRI